MKKAQRKDLYREIKKSFSRYLSMIGIIALGVAFYTGVKASEPDMQLTADKLYDDTSYMDIRIISTLGLTDEDVEAIAGTDGVKKACGGYTGEALGIIGDDSYVMLLYSIDDEINRPVVNNGRLPEKENECFVDDDLLLKGSFKLGDTISFTSGNSGDISDTITETEFTIVGSGDYPSYLSWDKGTASIGSGDADAFVLLPESAFASEVYTVVYVNIEDAKELNSFSNKYTDLTEEIKDRIGEIEGERCLARYEEVLREPQQEIADAKQKLADKKAEIADAKDKLLKEKDDLNKQKEQLAMMPEYMQVQYAAAIAEGEKAIEAAEKELLDGEKAISDAEAEIADAEKKLEDVKVPEWYILGRDSIQSYVEYGQDTERIGAIGDVFPVIFFLVAALVSLTTMTRMVEDGRTEIGTLKALGYGKGAIISKYINYSLSASLIGSVIGIAVGSYVLPKVIISAYGILYTGIPATVTPVQWIPALVSAGIATGCSLAATIAACLGELVSAPAVLMRPVAPAAGKRVLIERLTFIWNRLNFTGKYTARNIFRYKKRFFMTIFGIGGCMALLMVGFGLRDSIKTIVTKQYNTVWTYDAYMTLNDEYTNAEKSELADELRSKEEKIADMLFVHQVSCDFSNSDGSAESGAAGAKDETKEVVEKSAYIYIPERTEGLDCFVDLHSRTEKEKYVLDNDGAIISEKLAKLLNVSVGDTIYLKESETVHYPVYITAIAENYLYHYVYMTPEYYESITGKRADYNMLMLRLNYMNDAQRDVFSERLLLEEWVDGFMFVTLFENKVENMMSSLDFVIWVLIVSAGMLAVIVLFNLNNINIIERKRELATIKVLGFYDMELAGFVYRENILLTVFGVAIGVIFGYFLHGFVIKTCEIDMIMFGRDISTMSYLYSILLTFVFSMLVNLAMYYKLKKVDMVESLKSIE